MTDSTSKNYIAIVKLENGDVLWPETIDGNTKDINAILTLKGHYKDGRAWEREVLRSKIIDIAREPEENNDAE